MFKDLPPGSQFPGLPLTRYRREVGPRTSERAEILYTHAELTHLLAGMWEEHCIPTGRRARYFGV